jgi:hypothetical protein
MIEVTRYNTMNLRFFLTIIVRLRILRLLSRGVTVCQVPRLYTEEIFARTFPLGTVCCIACRHSWVAIEEWLPSHSLKLHGHKCFMSANLAHAAYSVSFYRLDCASYHEVQDGRSSNCWLAATCLLTTCSQLLTLATNILHRMYQYNLRIALIQKLLSIHTTQCYPSK